MIKIIIIFVGFNSWLLKEWQVVVETYFVILTKEMASTMKTKIILTKMMNLLPKALKKLVK